MPPSQKDEWTHVVVLRRKEDNFVKLREVGNEIIYAWTLRSSPTVLPLCVFSKLMKTRIPVKSTHIPGRSDQKVIQRKQQRVWFLVRRW